MLNVLLFKGEKKRLWYTDGQILPKCFRRGGGMLQHFNVTDFIFSQKPPVGWAAMNSKMSEVKEKNGFQNEMGTMYGYIFMYLFILANACA